MHLHFAYSIYIKFTTLFVLDLISILDLILQALLGEVIKYYYHQDQMFHHRLHLHFPSSFFFWQDVLSIYDLLIWPLQLGSKVNKHY